MARRSMFVALTKGFTSPPVPNGPASAFEGTGGSLAGAFLHKQFMQGRPSWRHPQEPEGPERHPAASNGSPFRPPFPERASPPRLQKFS
jgi:hypothetical protein